MAGVLILEDGTCFPVMFSAIGDKAKGRLLLIQGYWGIRRSLLIPLLWTDCGVDLPLNR